jgi:stage II sporulation protein M
MKKKKVLKKKFSLREGFLESLSNIRESKFYIYLIVGIFFLVGLFAFFVPAPMEIQNQILSLIKDILKQTEGMNFFQMFWFIFLNNLKASFVGMVSGIIFGIFSIIIGIVNGYFLGFVAMMSVNSEGILVLWKLFPHGIFELPAIFISLGLGLRMGVYIFKKNPKEKFTELFIKCLKSFFFVVFPLLVIAGLIEAFLIILC